MQLLHTSFSSKGQMVLPAKLRSKYGIEQGTRVTLQCDEHGFYVRKTSVASKTPVAQVMGLLARLEPVPMPASVIPATPTRAKKNANDVACLRHAIAQQLLADDDRIKSYGALRLRQPAR